MVCDLWERFAKADLVTFAKFRVYWLVLAIRRLIIS